MLVLTRRTGEQIRIGDDVTVRVLEIRRGQVRLSIDAPRSVAVHREEIYAQVQRENRLAAEAGNDLDPAELWRRSRGEK